MAGKLETACSHLVRGTVKQPNAAYRSAAHSRSGFTLVQLSILLAVTGVMLAAYLPGRDAGDYNQKVLATLYKLDKIEAAMQGFMAKNGYRPCPADGQYDVNHQFFGREAGASTTSTPIGGCVGGVPAAPMGPDTGSGHVFMGTIPTKTLDLPDEYAYDAWGRRFSYVVDGRVTVNKMCYDMITAQTPGAIAIQWKDPAGAVVETENSFYAYISHGPDGHGAWPPQGSNVAGRTNRNSLDPDTLTNAGVDSSFTYTTAIFSATKVKKDRTTAFDDLVYYHKDTRNVCCIGKACQLFNLKAFSVGGENVNYHAGKVVQVVDVNNDGIDDQIIAAPDAAPGGRLDAGAVYVIFGSSVPVINPVDVTTLTGSNGFIVEGNASGDHLGESLASGDVNGDGIMDIIVGAPNAPGGADNGNAYVIFGGGGAWPASFDVGNLAGSTGINGTNGFIIEYDINNDLAASAVSSGDVNGDQVSDVLIGVPNADSGDGRTCVVFGKSTTWTGFTPLLVSTLSGANGTCYMGETSTNEGTGAAVQACDVNGDGIHDIIAGAPRYERFGEVNVGRVHVLFGKSAAFTATGTFAASNGVIGYHHLGVWRNHRTGKRLACGDFNGDGIQDLVIAAPTADTTGTENGIVYVNYGTTASHTASMDLNDLRYYKDDQDGGVRIDGANGEQLGEAVAMVPDINGDGLNDLAIGAPMADPPGKPDAGRAYVVYASPTGMLSTNTVTALPTERTVKIEGPETGAHAGATISGGNTNVARESAVIVGAPDATVGANASAGKALNVQGRKLREAVTYDSSAIP